MKASALATLTALAVSATAGAGTRPGLWEPEPTEPAQNPSRARRGTGKHKQNARRAKKNGG